jgi:hypothetical protein
MSMFIAGSRERRSKIDQRELTRSGHAPFANVFWTARTRTGCAQRGTYSAKGESGSASIARHPSLPAYMMSSRSTGTASCRLAR